MAAVRPRMQQGRLLMLRWGVGRKHGRARVDQFWHHAGYQVGPAWSGMSLFDGEKGGMFFMVNEILRSAPSSLERLVWRITFVDVHFRHWCCIGFPLVLDSLV